MKNIIIISALILGLMIGYSIEDNIEMKMDSYQIIIDNK